LPDRRGENYTILSFRRRTGDAGRDIRTSEHLAKDPSFCHNNVLIANRPPITPDRFNEASGNELWEMFEMPQTLGCTHPYNLWLGAQRIVGIHVEVGGAAVFGYETFRRPIEEIYSVRNQRNPVRPRVPQGGLYGAPPSGMLLRDLAVKEKVSCGFPWEKGFASFGCPPSLPPDRSIDNHDRIEQAVAVTRPGRKRKK